MLTRLVLFVYALTTILSTAHAQTPDSTSPDSMPLSAETVMSRMFDTRQVEDEIAVLEFVITKPNGEEQRVTYTMLWKNNHGKNGFDQKVIFVTDFPPSRKGVAYMGFLRQAGSNANDEEWIYLPELAMVRRIAHRGRDQSDDDEFGLSILKREHLDPRPPELDDHRLLESESVGETAHYKVESRVKTTGNQTMPFDTYHTWVDATSFRPARVQFFLGGNTKPELDMTIEWTQVNNQWVWKRVSAVAPDSGAKTVMNISKIKVNSGLKDTVFSKRSLSRGIDRYIR